MNNLPDISIITPAYNRADLLPRVWRSISGQCANYEWIVVDDASEDDTEAIINNIDDPRIVYVGMPENRGVNAARNAGVIASRGRYIVFLDSDDELYPDSLHYAIESMEHADRNIGVALFSCLNASTNCEINKPTDGQILSEYDVVCERRLAGGDMICVYRREVFDYFKLPENLKGCEQVFVFQTSTKYKFLMVNKPLSIVHRQSDNLSRGESIVERSFDIGKSYEIILDNHAVILSRHTFAMDRYLGKAMYRYGVAGSRKDVWRVYKRFLRSKSKISNRLKVTGLLIFCMLDLTRFERKRINRLNKRLSLSQL